MMLRYAVVSGVEVELARAEPLDKQVQAQATKSSKHSRCRQWPSL